MKNDWRNFVLILLLGIVVFFGTTLYWMIDVQRANETSDDLALSLSQVNELADERSPVIGQINEVLSRNGYQHLKRKIVKKIKEEVLSE